MNTMNHPRVGIGLIIENPEGLILTGRRLGGHGPYHSILGGHLELGETFEQAAIRETAEETGLIVHNPKFVCVTNNLETYKKEGLHYISIIMHTKEYEGEPRLMEPHKCAGWEWVDPNKLREPHFEPSRIGVGQWLNK